MDAGRVDHYQCVLSSHLSGYLSGVARFNQLLAMKLAVACIGWDEAADLGDGPVLLSIKLQDHSEGDLDGLERACDILEHRRIVYDVFFHSFQRRCVEERLLHGCRQAFGGNAEIAASIRSAGHEAAALWCPALLDASAAILSAPFTIFSFGMSHKVQVNHYARLKELLDSAEVPAELLVSTAFHEKANFGDIEAIAEHLQALFGDRVHLLGFLSDAAVSYFLARCDLFCAFFPEGVRANNTTVYAAMEAAAPVLTNLDTYSPEWMRHRRTVLDLGKTDGGDFDADLLSDIADAARQAVEANAAWDALTARLTSNLGRTPGAFGIAPDARDQALAVHPQALKR